MTDLTSKRATRWWLWVPLAAVVMLAVVHHRGWSTEPMRLADGRELRVLDFDRRTARVVQADGSFRVERYFWVRYYATVRGSEAMRREARSVAPDLFPITDSLGFAELRVEPARPIFVRALPIGVISEVLRFKRDSAGSWWEVGG